MLAEAAYGKSSVRLVKVSRHRDRHDLIDLTVAVRFEGDYDASYVEGDNSGVLPTDTMKNTVYALAGKGSLEDPESFGLTLSQHFLERNPRLRRVRVDLTEHPWGRIPVGSRGHGHAFMRAGAETRSATVQRDRTHANVGSGIADLVILKSSQSAFKGFLRDEYTTLPDATDRILATSLTATWRYQDADVEFGACRSAVRTTLLETFAEHDSRSVQHTLHAMAQAVLDNVDSVVAVRLVMPNRHHLPVDVARFGIESRNELFIPTDEPYGLIEATVVRAEC
jgi:urate oxidase